MTKAQKEARRPWGFAALLLIAAFGFCALGVWQVHRLHWKHALIARVDARVHAKPGALPPTSRLDTEEKNAYEYLRVALSGHFRPRQTALVRAATELGTGYWAMTVLETDKGRAVWINRGYVPSGITADDMRKSVPAGPVHIIGLVRASEPGGSLLQSNKPAQDRWYSRDVAALAQSRKAGNVAPVFIDAQREQSTLPKGAIKPVANLTVIHFPDNHLVYALTWFTLCALSLFGIFLAWRRSGRSLV